jgi:hypothetical protein
LGTTWTYLEDHLREQGERIDNLLSDTLRAGEPIGPEELYLYYKKVCQFLDTEEGESNVNDLVTMDQWTCCCTRCPRKRPSGGDDGVVRSLRST